MIAAVPASSSRTRIALVMLASGLLSVSAAAVTQGATQDEEAPKLSVRYDDLDIDTEEGARTLHRRIVTAATEVCPEPSKFSMRVTALSRKCVAAAVARAVREVNSPLLAKVDAERNKRAAKG
jgi:UrcA family protein